MSGRMIITFTGAIKLAFRFINRLLGLLLVFSGGWFWLVTYVPYRAAVESMDSFRNSIWGSEIVGFMVIGIAALGNLTLLEYNCKKFYSVMPDNVFTRLIRSIIEGGYRPEREGNNVPKNMLFMKPAKQGFFFGVKKFKSNSEFNVCKSADTDGHILVVGGAGSGKSACIAKNTLETWTDPIVAIDIKGELSAHCERLKAAGAKRRIVIFDPTSADGLGFDPYYLLHHGGEENLVQNAREIALSIVSLSPNVRDPFWIQAAQNVLTAAILYFFDIGASFAETMTAIQTTPIDKLCEDIYNSENTAAKMFINQARDLELKTLAGIATELSNKIMVFAADPQIRAALCDSTKADKCFDWEHVFGSGWSVFIRIPENKLEQWASVTALMMNQAFRTLERRPDKGAESGEADKGGKTDKGSKTAEIARPVLMLLDEAARLGKIDTIKSALATLRSKNVTICLILQSLAQLDEIYGKDARRTIVDNCAYKAILSATDADSQEYFSRLVGTCEVEKESYGKNYDADSGIETSANSHWSKYREPIIFPHEFAKLKDIAIMTPEGFCRAEKVFAPRL